MLKKKYLYKPKHLISLNKKIKKLKTQNMWDKIKSKLSFNG